MGLDDRASCGASSSSITNKRVLAAEGDTHNKRVCLSDPSGRPMPSPVHPVAIPGVMARADSAQVNNHAVDHAIEVVQPMRRAFEKIRGKCINCLLRGDEDWETHQPDHCVHSDMAFGYDETFTKFKKEFKFVKCCFLCGVRDSFLNPPVTI